MKTVSNSLVQDSIDHSMDPKASDVESAERLNVLRNFLIENPQVLEEVNNILILAKDSCNKPICFILPPDDFKDWVVAPSNINLQLTEKEILFCRSANNGSEVLVVSDTKSAFARTKYNIPHDISIRFYAGSALITNDGFNLGILCLIDERPNKLGSIQKRILKSLAMQIVHISESRMAEKELKERLYELEEKNQSLRAIAQMQSHEIRRPFSSILGLLNLAEEDAMEMDKEWLKMTIDVAKILDTKIRSVVNEAMGTIDIKLVRDSTIWLEK